jgi:alkaline phosphatase D
MPESPMFRHGVASGDPLSDRVVIWTRCEQETELTWTVARDEALRHVVRSDTAAAHAEEDLTVKVDVDGLEPDTTYYYFFEAGEHTSPVGRTQTLPQTCDQFRFAMYSCAKYSAGYFNAHARMAERDDIAFVLCLGDYIYEYGNDEKGLGARIGRAFEPDHECRKLEDYRTRYSQYRRDPKLQRLHQRHAFINIVDDHEFCNDTWRDGAGKHEDAEDGPWAERKAAAFQAWREWIPIRLPDPDDPTRIYRTFPLGGLADLILLDTRTRRDEQTKDPQALEHADRTLLGKEQFDWFTNECDRSTATWRIIANAVMIGQVKSEFMPEDLGNPLSELGVLTKREHGPEPDQWDGYPVERRRVLECVKQHSKRNIVFLSGDCHSSWAMDLKLDPEQPEQESIGGEFCTTSLTSENLDDEAGWDPRTRSLEIEKEVIDRNPHIHWVETDSHGYVIVDINSERAQGDWWFVDQIHNLDDGQHHGGSWLIRANEDRVRKAPGPVS